MAKVYVVERGTEFFVTPPIIVLHENDALQIMNYTGQDLAWVVPNAEPFGSEVCDVVKKKGAGSGHTPRPIASKKTGVYEYQITMLQSGKKAKGNSDPMIIVD